jgi:hypothetical protein
LSGEIFRLAEIAAIERVPTSVDRNRQTVKARRFLKGPIPWPWIEAAARLPGKALAVGLVLWREAGMDGSGSVKLTTAKLAGLDLDRAGKARAQGLGSGWVGACRAERATHAAGQHHRRRALKTNHEQGWC